MSQNGFGAPNPVPSIVPPVSKVDKLDFQVEFHQNTLELDGRTPFGVAHLTRRLFDIRTSNMHLRGPTICHIETDNVPKCIRGPKSGAFHRTPLSQGEKLDFQVEFHQDWLELEAAPDVQTRPVST